MRSALPRSSTGSGWIVALVALVALACTRPLPPSGASSSGATPASAVSSAVPAAASEPPLATSAPPARPTEAVLREHFASLQRGEPNYDDMSPRLAEIIRAHPDSSQMARDLGAVQSMTFRGTGPRGADIYEVTTDNGLSEWRIKLAPDGKIEALFFRPLGKPSDAPPSDRQLAADLAEHVRAAAAKEEFSGAVSIARGTTPLFQLATGFADRERQRPNTLDTKFQIASMNKMFTAIAILQLAASGKLSLSDPLGKFSKDYPNADVARRVTIEHLLTHTGGTGDIFGPDFAKHRQKLRKLGDYVALFGQRGLAFPPGERFEYSNYGFVLLGVVIENVTGESYYRYIDEHVYAPAGMADSGFLAVDQAQPERAIGYTRFRPEGSPKPKAGQLWFPNTEKLPYRGSSAGGGYSTVADLLAFANALDQHRLLDGEHTALLTTAHGDVAKLANYAFGFMDETIAGVRCIGHNGGGPGMSAFFRICRRLGEGTPLVIAVLSNQDPPSAPEIGEYVRLHLPAGAASDGAVQPDPVPSGPLPSGPLPPVPPPSGPLPPAAPPVARDCAGLAVDDLEDGDERGMLPGGVEGVWQSFQDASGTTLGPGGAFGPSPGGPRPSKQAVHISGKLGASRESWAGVELRPAGASAALDLSPWAAVCFKAKGVGFARFEVADTNTDPAGGHCKRCYNHCGATIELTADWREHCVAFDEMTQQYGWGEPQPSVVPTSVFGALWSVHTPESVYDLWVDEVRLVCR
jgi:D-alanyl-D-alanine carboxypeptidase